METDSMILLYGKRIEELMDEVEKLKARETSLKSHINERKNFYLNISQPNFLSNDGVDSMVNNSVLTEISNIEKILNQ